MSVRALSMKKHDKKGPTTGLRTARVKHQRLEPRMAQVAVLCHSASDPVDAMTHSDEGMRDNECIQQGWTEQKDSL